MRLMSAALGTAAMLTGCGERAAPAPADAAGPVESAAERGPVRVTVRAERGVVTVGEKLALTVEVFAAAGVEVRMPVPEETLGPFEIRRRETPPDVPEPDGRRWTHRYVVDTFAAGPAEVPPFTVEFTDARPETLDADGAAIESSIVSEPLAIEVRSVLAEGETEADFRDISGAVAVPVEPAPARGFLIAGVAALALAAMGAVVLVLLRRSAGATAIVTIEPPEVWARRALAALAERELPEAGYHHEFYFELSGIVRGYIERRFRLSAPERTTEEFLREARRDGALTREHQDLLAGFLRAADMVKFALHEPTLAEARAAFDAGSGFVDETAPRVVGGGEVAA